MYQSKRELTSIARNVMNPSTLIRGCLCLWLLAALVVFYLAGRMLIADINAHQADSFVRDWTKRGKIRSERAWQVASLTSERSLRLFPVKNGAYLALNGQVHEWRHSSLSAGDPEAAASRQSAKQSYLSSTEFRPQWPYTWGRLAFIKMQLLEFDDEFDRALRNSMAMGPWRPQIMFTIAEVGMTSWYNLTHDQRELVVDAIRRLAVQEPKTAKNLIALGVDAQLHGFDCRAFDLEPPVEDELCASASR